MRKKILQYYFFTSVLVGSIIYILQKLRVKLPSIINNYVNDFLIIPIVLIICLFVLRWSRGDKSYKIPIGVVLLICVFYSVFFEYFLPKFYPRYTADIVDVLLYFVGGVVFYWLQFIEEKK